MSRGGQLFVSAEAQTASTDGVRAKFCDSTPTEQRRANTKSVATDGGSRQRQSSLEALEKTRYRLSEPVPHTDRCVRVNLPHNGLSSSRYPLSLRAEAVGGAVLLHG